MTEIKTPTDVDTYYALIQVLAGASMLLTETQFARLDVTYPGVRFTTGPAGPQVDAAILTVDPKRCAHEWQPSKGDPRYRKRLDAIARDVAARLRDTDITTLIPRISNISLGLDDGVLSAGPLW